MDQRDRDRAARVFYGFDLRPIDHRREVYIEAIAQAQAEARAEALAPVVALHKPYELPLSGETLCDHDEFPWPCETYRAVVGEGA